MSTKHTPTPWARDLSIGMTSGGYIRAASGELVVSCQHAYGRLPVPASANAAFIVQSVNSHDALVAALEQLLDDMGADGHSVCEAAKQLAIRALSTLQDKTA